MCFYVLENLDVKNLKVEFENGHLVVSAQSVHDMLGLPLGGESFEEMFIVDEDNEESCMFESKKQFSNIKDLRLKQLENETLLTREADYNFIINFLVIMWRLIKVKWQRRRRKEVDNVVEEKEVEKEKEKDVTISLVADGESEVEIEKEPENLEMQKEGDKDGESEVEIEKEPENLEMQKEGDKGEVEEKKVKKFENVAEGKEGDNVVVMKENEKEKEKEGEDDVGKVADESSNIVGDKTFYSLMIGFWNNSAVDKLFLAATTQTSKAIEQSMKLEKKEGDMKLVGSFSPPSFNFGISQDSSRTSKSSPSQPSSPAAIGPDVILVNAVHVFVVPSFASVVVVNAVSVSVVPSSAAKEMETKPTKP
ncbi:hypothetical protein LXL04_020885 [Taraxacum kok-saghyz]